MHFLDFLLKGLILKLAIAVLLVLAAAVTVVVLIWIARRFLRNRSWRMRTAVLVIATPLVFLAVTYTFAAAASTVIYHLWVKPAGETHTVPP